jgi:signal transduction histidine kinase
MTTAFDHVLALVDEARAGATVPPAARAEALRNALALLDACGGTADGLTVATISYAAELLGSIAVDLAANPTQSRRLIDQLQTRAAVPRVALGRELLRTGRLLELGVEIAIEVQLSLLVAFTGARSISLWTLDGDGEVRHVAHTGALDPSGSPIVTAVTAALAGERSGVVVTGEGTLGLRIDGLRPPPAVLFAHGVDPALPHPEPLLQAAAPIMAGLLDRETVLGRELSQQSLSAAVERRLARLRFDLHDGPQQDVHLLAQDLQLFRDQLRPMIAGDPDQDRALGRLDDLKAQLVALDGDLRRLSTSVQSPFLTADSLPDALAQVADAFAERTGIVPATEVKGDLAHLTDSQQIAMLALIREALSNIRKHGDATEVRIEIASTGGGLTVEVSDNGSGFDPEATLVRAAQAGRLGLVGMHERVRMLGGRTQINSRPGGPTVISATLPAWSSADR